MDMSNFHVIDSNEFKNAHSKTLYRSICVPSMVQSYSLCIEYIKNWFLSKFGENVFKTVYIDGKNIFDEYRKLSKLEIVKKQKPALAIVPSINWDFNNDNIDSYPYGLELYTQTGRFKDSFFSCPETNSYLGIGLELILMPFTFHIKLETRAQQLDMYKYIKMACRVGFTCGENVDLDFHIPYKLILQMARDNGFETYTKKDEELIKDIPKFLRWLNMHSALPFLYKHRALNGKNEFFLRMKNMYVHIRPTDLSADDGERESQMMNNFNIDLSIEVRFPAPKMYAYYSDNAHKLTEIYGAWYQPNGTISTCYTFKKTIIQDKNKYNWPLLLNTTYEIDPEEVNTKISIDLSELFVDDEIGGCIKDCLSKGISPGIFCDIVFYNNAEYLTGKLDWETMIFKSNNIVRGIGTYIGIYVDNDFLSDYILEQSNAYKTRVNKSKEKKQ